MDTDYQGRLAPSNRAAPSPMAVSRLDCNCRAGGRCTCDCPNRDNSLRETFSQPKCCPVRHVVLPSPPERNLAQPPRGLSRCQAARPRTGEGVSGMVAESCCFSHVDEGDGSGHALQLTTGWHSVSATGATPPRSSQVSPSRTDHAANRSGIAPTPARALRGVRPG